MLPNKVQTMTNNCSFMECLHNHSCNTTCRGAPCHEMYTVKPGLSTGYLGTEAKAPCLACDTSQRQRLCMQLNHATAVSNLWKTITFPRVAKSCSLAIDGLKGLKAGGTHQKHTFTKLRGWDNTNAPPDDLIFCSKCIARSALWVTRAP